jgi:predicted DNA-binding protein
MERTQISLTSKQFERLRRASAERGVSMAHLVREAVDAYVVERSPSRAELAQRALAGAGRFRSGASDVAERHDDYLAEDPHGW